MIFVFSTLLLILCLCNRKSKIVFVLGIIFLWILFGWSSNNADSGIYLNRYNNYGGNIFSITEPLFTSIMQIFNSLHFEYQQFLVVISICILAIYGIVIYKLTANINFVLLLYFIFPFSMEVVQLRFTMATAVIVVGFYFLIKDDKKKGIIKYICCVIIATLLHYASIFFIIMILPKLCKRKKVIFITTFGIVFLFVMFTLLSNITIPGTSTLANKINYVLKSASTKYTIKNIFNVCFRIIVYFILYYIANIITQNRLKKFEEDDKDKKLEICEIVLKMNIVSLLIIPVTLYSVDIYRIQQALTIINYITLSYYFKKTSTGMINKKNMVFCIYTLFMAFINLYLLVLSNNNINTVFIPLFKNNLFFG